MSLSRPGAEGTTDLVGCVRVGIAVIGVIALLAGVFIMLTVDIPGGAWVAVLGAAMLGVVLYERMRYRTRSSREGGGGSGVLDLEPPPGYERTDETFTDPTTGERMRVWYHPATGDRRYIPEP